MTIWETQKLKVEKMKRSTDLSYYSDFYVKVLSYLNVFFFFYHKRVDVQVRTF